MTMVDNDFLQQRLDEAETLQELVEEAMKVEITDPHISQERLSRSVFRVSERIINKEFQGSLADHPRYGRGVVERVFWSEDLDEWRVVYRVEESQNTVEVPASPPLTTFRVAGNISVNDT